MFIFRGPHLLYIEFLGSCQNVQQNFAQMYDISKKFFILYDECLIFTSNLVKMYIQTVYEIQVEYSLCNAQKKVTC